MLRSGLKAMIWPDLEHRLDSMNRQASDQADRIHTVQQKLRHHEGKLSSELSRSSTEGPSTHDLLNHELEQLRAGAADLARDLAVFRRDMDEQGNAVHLQARRHDLQLAVIRGELEKLRAKIQHGTGPDLSLSRAVTELAGHVPLSWVRSTKRVPFSNFGDALSPLVVSVMAGLPVAHRAFDSSSRRMAAVGTIGQGQRAGSVHFWGTGFDSIRDTKGDQRRGFVAAPDVEYVIHALRGPFTRRALLAEGIAAPSIYGDPAWFLPRILHPKVDKTHELGVILHISELETPSPDATSVLDQARFDGAQASGVRVISTYHDPSWLGFVAKLREMLSCKRIVSNSFHGLLLADAYQIPCLYFPNTIRGLQRFDIEGHWDTAVNHRFADFYRGIGRSSLFAYGQPQSEPTAWDNVMAIIDRYWEPTNFTGEHLFDAFPLAPCVDFSDASWPIDDKVAAALPW